MDVVPDFEGFFNGRPDLEQVVRHDLAPLIRLSEIVNQPANRLEPVRIAGRGANQIVEQGVATGADAPVEAVLLLPVIHRPVDRGIETAEQRAQEPQELLRAVQQGAEHLVHAIGRHPFSGKSQRQTDVVYAHSPARAAERR